MKRKRIALLGCILWMGSWANAQSAQDLAALKNLIGTFKVTFNYAETFTNDTLVKKYAHPMDQRAVVEVVHALEQGPKKWVLQHILVAGGAIIKHWREDWEFEKTTLWDYDKDKNWVKKELPAAAVKGQWTQTVWEVDDAPRYQGISQWVSTNGQYFWLNSTDAPLPRREYTKRNDYNVMNRTNRIIITPKGWMHEQDNKKWIRVSGKKDSLLAEEKGYNEYIRVDDALGAPALAFWTMEKAGFWQEVRTHWEHLMNTSKILHLENRVNDQFLYEALDEVEQKKLSGDGRRKAIEKTMKDYVQVK